MKKELKIFFNSALEFFPLEFNIFNLGQHFENQIFAQFSSKHPSVKAPEPLLTQTLRPPASCNLHLPLLSPFEKYALERVSTTP